MSAPRETSLKRISSPAGMSFFMLGTAAPLYRDS